LEQAILDSSNHEKASEDDNRTQHAFQDWDVENIFSFEILISITQNIYSEKSSQQDPPEGPFPVPGLAIYASHIGKEANQKEDASAKDGTAKHNNTPAQLFKAFGVFRSLAQYHSFLLVKDRQNPLRFVYVVKASSFRVGGAFARLQVLQLEMSWQCGIANPLQALLFCDYSLAANLVLGNGQCSSFTSWLDIGRIADPRQYASVSPPTPSRL